jgi:hypothetical protein
MFNLLCSSQFKKVSVLFLLTGLVLSFQNCSGVEFSKASIGGNSKLDGGTGDSVLTPVPENEDQNQDQDDDEYADDDKDYDYDDDKDDKDYDDDDKNCRDCEKNRLQSICILEGPGRSVRLGLINDELAAVGQTPRVVCTTERACSEIVSKKFDVKSSERRGFCNGQNPHVVRLNENEISNLINADNE